MQYLYPVHDVVRMRPYRVLEADDRRNHHIIWSADTNHTEHALEGVWLLHVIQACMAAALSCHVPCTELDTMERLGGWHRLQSSFDARLHCHTYGSHAGVKARRSGRQPHMGPVRLWRPLSSSPTCMSSSGSSSSSSSSRSAAGFRLRRLGGSASSLSRPKAACIQTHHPG